MKESHGIRLLEKMVEKMSLNEGISINLPGTKFNQYQVILPYEFVRACRKQKQKGQALEPIVWDDSTPRKVFSEDGYVLFATMPNLMGPGGTACVFISFCVDNWNERKIRLKSPITC
jgi:hypothetical protein